MKYANISVLALLIVLIAAGAFTDGGVVFFMLLPLGLSSLYLVFYSWLFYSRWKTSA